MNTNLALLQAQPYYAEVKAAHARCGMYSTIENFLSNGLDDIVPVKHDAWVSNIMRYGGLNPDTGDRMALLFMTNTPFAERVAECKGFMHPTSMGDHIGWSVTHSQCTCGAITHYESRDHRIWHSYNMFVQWTNQQL